MSQTIRSREVRFASRPDGIPTAETFALAETEVPPPAEGEVQVRNLWMSVDPYMRGRMTTRKSYVPPFVLGEVLQGGAVGRVVASRSDDFATGDLVQSMCGWREAFNAKAAALTLVPRTGLPAEAMLGIAGLPGLTAFIGITEVAKVGAGDVVFVSGAAGAVGSVACQIAKIRGATVIGSAGGPIKCDYLREIGCDAVIDYKAAGDLTSALADAAPEGIDVYFENVGGIHLEAALEAANPFARFALCGMISQSNATSGSGPANLANAVRKRLRLQGFIASDHFDRMPSFVEAMAGWVAKGRMKWRQSVDEGIEAAPAAFLKLFSGDNLGKMLVRLSD